MYRKDICNEESDADYLINSRVLQWHCSRLVLPSLYLWLAFARWLDLELDLPRRHFFIRGFVYFELCWVITMPINNYLYFLVSC